MSLENAEGRKRALGNFVLGKYIDKSDSFVEPKLGKVAGVLIPPKYLVIKERKIQRQT
jgi:hypothetical protein